MTTYNYLSAMQEFSYRTVMALAVLGNVKLQEFYKKAEQDYSDKLEKLSVEEAKENINPSQIDQYLRTKEFCETKEREAAEKIKRDSQPQEHDDCFDKWLEMGKNDPTLKEAENA